MRSIVALGLILLPLLGGCDSERSGASGAPGAAPGAASGAASGAPSGAPAAIASGASGAPSAAPSGGAAASSSAAITLTPDDERQARGALVNDCMACHTEEMLAQQRLTPKQWASVVKKMQGWGSRLEAANAEKVVAYLAARYGLSAPPYEPPLITAEAAAAAVASLPDGPFAGGDKDRGYELYKKACLACHGENGRGSTQGVAISDRPILYRAPDFAAILRASKGRMPAFPDLKEKDIADLLVYLRRMRP